MNTFPRQLNPRPGVTLTLDPTRVVLAFKNAPTRALAVSAASGLGLVPEQSDSATAAPNQGEAINNSEVRYWMHSSTAAALPEDISARSQEVFGDSLNWVGPVYRFENEAGRKALLCPLPNVLLVKPTRSALRAGTDLAGHLRAYGLREVPEKSRYLGEFRYFVLDDPLSTSAYDVYNNLLENEKELIQELRYDTMPMVIPTAVSPNDPMFAQQWDMVRIQAGGVGVTGWDRTRGNGVIVCILDQGCDLTHPDLHFSTPGINLGTMAPNGSPTGNHGTACAGIVAAAYNNAQGVAGVAGECQIMPLAFDTWADTEVAAGINYAANPPAGVTRADVISMSFGWNAWDHTIIDPAIQNAHNAGLVMCVATHNYDSAITYPATNPLVMACGASDEIDNRKSPTSPDGESWWGSDFGPEMSVVAPGVHIPTTDRQGNVGYNTSPGTAGDYFMTFNGTSSATPHVAGLAALICSRYPALTNAQVRSIIERTAEKVGTVAYVETPGYPNGTWNQEMGYGRINALRSLDFADVMIKDYPGDTGVEPSTPPGGNFWDFSDIVIRPTDDSVFAPDSLDEARRVERGQTNYLYVRVTNNGQNAAHNVVVNARITPYVGLQFIYPTDWTLIDAMHVSPVPILASFLSIPSGGTVIAKFSISAAQVEDLWGWTSSHPWHPCLLASVNSDDDFAFASASVAGDGIVRRRNNFAQRNLSVVDTIPGATVEFPFVAGNLYSIERAIEITVDRKYLPREMEILMGIDEDLRVFPTVEKYINVLQPVLPEIGRRVDNSFIFLDRVRVEMPMVGGGGVLTVEEGSNFSFAPSRRLENIYVKDGEVFLRNMKRFVDLRELSPVVRMDVEPGQLYPLGLQINIPNDAKPGQRYMVSVAERNSRGETIGGATVVCQIR